VHSHPFQASLRALGFLISTGLVVILAMAWTLSRGPVELTPLAPIIERALDQALQNAGLPLQASIGAVVLTWRADAVATGGPAAGLEVDLRQTRLTDPEGHPVAHLGTVAVDLKAGALVRGEVSLETLTLVGPDLRLVRDENGGITLDLAGLTDGAAAPSAPDIWPLTPNMSPNTSPAGDTAKPPLLLDEVVETWTILAGMGFAVRDARLSLVDQAAGRVWTMRADGLRLRPQGDALLLEGSLRLPGTRGPAATLDVALRHHPGKDLASLMIALRGLDPARHLASVPGLEGLADWHQSLSGTAAVDLDITALSTTIAGAPGSAGAPLRFVDLALQGGPGRVGLPPPIGRDYDVRALTVEATLSDGTVTLSTVTLDLDGSPDDPADGVPNGTSKGTSSGARITATGRAQGFLDGPPQASIDLIISPLDVPTLVSLWPGHVAHGGYKWIDENLSDGGVGESRFSVTLAGTDWESLAVTALHGETHAEGLTVHYLGDLPSATGATGRLTFGPDDIVIDQITGTVDSGTGGTLSVVDGMVRLFDLDTDIERADMQFRIDGPLPAVLALIDHQPLGYATKVGIQPGDARGQVETTLRIALPLIKDLDLEALDVGVEATAADVALPAVTLGQDLRNGALTLTLDNAGMDVTGQALLGQVPITLDWRENFTDSADFDRRYQVRGRADTAARARFGLVGPPFGPPWLDGPVDVELTYTESGETPGHLEADVDLSPATMAVPMVGWRKAPGDRGRVAVDGWFDDKRMTVAFDATAAPEALAVTGEARLTAAGDLLGLTVSRLRLGATDARAEVIAPAPGSADPWRVALTGSTLDARALLSTSNGDDDSTTDPVPETAAPAADTEPDGPPTTPLDISMDVERLLLHGSITLETARVGLTRDAAGRWQKASVDGRINGKPAINFQLQPGDDGLRHFTLKADDAGAVVRALDLNQNLRDGRFTLTGTLDDNGVAQGRLKGRDLFFTDAPAVVRLLAVASLTGILEELQGQGLWLNQLVVPFTYADPLLTLREARANGPSLGLTASGTLNLDSETMTLNGVVVPAYLVNSLLGRIPLLGDLLVGEKGGGVFAVTYKAKGPMDDPNISVNPLTLLTPGFLRDLFGVFPDRPKNGDSRPPNGATDDAPSAPGFPDRSRD